MMWRRLLIIDLVLLAVLVAGVIRVRQSWIEFEASHRVESVRPEKETVRPIPGASLIAAVPQDWTEISVKDPFSFDRNDVSYVAPKQTLPTQPKPVLFGTMSIGKEWIAMLAPAQSGNRTSRPVKVGESVDDWQVVEIGDKSVLVTGPSGLRETLVMNQTARIIDRTPTGNTTPQPPIVINTPSVSTPGPATPPPTPPAAQPGTPGQPVQEMLNTPFGPVPKTKP